MQLKMATPSVAERFDDDRRRHRPGHRSARPEQLGRRARAPSRSQAGHGSSGCRSATASRSRSWSSPTRSWRPPRRRCGHLVRSGWATHAPRIVRSTSVDDLGCDRRRARSPRSSPSCPTAASVSLPRPSRSAISRPRSPLPAIDHGTAPRAPASTRASRVVPVSVVKGLELDGVVVVEPTQIVADDRAGHARPLRGADLLTQRLTIVHAQLELPEPPPLTRRPLRRAADRSAADRFSRAA